MSNIFISYRREDAAAYAGRLCDHLNRLAGADRVFMDVEDIAPGDPFAAAIDDKMARCEIALIVIGPRWAAILRERAQQTKRDYVAHEIEAALARKIRTVPVLVGGATIADLEGLPGKLAVLSEFEVAQLRDDTFGEDCARLAKSLKLETGETGGFPLGRKAMAALAVCLALAVAGWLAYGSWSQTRARKAVVEQVFATAKIQAERGDYESAFRTYQDFLKTHPQNRAAMNLQLDAAMGWLENFRAAAANGLKSEEVAAARLDEILPVMDAGLARSNGKGPRAADILAHIGWAHWLNQKVAFREFGSAAERDLRKALEIDSSNVYAHAMLGNWLMQKGKTEEALEPFRRAGESNKAKPFVRDLQLAAMGYPRDSDSRVALIRIANEMRRNKESIDDRQRRRILSNYNPTVNSAEEITETLTAVPPADAWATYVWLDESRTDRPGEDYQRVQREFIRASILEIEQKRDEALAAFRTLQGELNRLGYDGRIVRHVEGALKRLSKR